MDPDEQIQIDFGDPELNDPDYEKKVGEADGDGTIETTPADGAPQQGGDATVAPQQQTADGQPAGADTGTGGAANGAGQQQPGDGDKGASPKVKADKDGNLVDKDGNIVATAGAERRAFERVQAQERYIARLEQDLEQARSKDIDAQVLNGAPAKLGLDAQETQMGLQAIAAFKRDPVATARWMLQETMRLGYNLPQIIGQDAQGQLNGSGLDLQAVKNMINEAVHPLVGDRQAQQREQEAHTEAQREYDRFMAGHDHAAVHEDAIAALVRQDRNMTPEVAYWRLREYAAANGLDFAKPLAQQVQARRQGGGAPNGNATPQAQRTPMPNGGAPTQDMRTGPVMAEPDEAWDNIVRQSLREAGMN